MPGGSDQEVLSIGIDVDVQTANRQVAGLQKDLSRHFKKVSKTVADMGKVSDNVNKKSAKGVDDLTTAYEQEARSVLTLSNVLAVLGRKAEKAGGAELKNIQKQVKETKKLFTARKAAFKEAAQQQQKEVKTSAKKLKKTFGVLFKGTGIGEKAQAHKKSGKAMAKRGGRIEKHGTKMGGLKGGALKGVGKAMGGIGKLVGVFSKIVPILGMAATAIMAVVKLFLDADAHVKEFNKAILQTASTSEFLGASAKGTAGDLALMKKQLDGIRSTAEEFTFNNDWGIMPKDHQEVISTLNQQGVSLRAMANESETAYKGARAYQQELMKVSVAYSRAFGLPMKEINDFQAEMFTEMGMGLEDSKLAFAQMSRAAADSGIASNKFFSMIRGVSSDLSLYNLRLGSAVKLLGMLGKVMNPREAQKFMQFAMQGLKGMSQDDRMKLNMLTGGKGKGIIKRDIANREKALHTAMGKAMGMKGKPSEIAKKVEEDIAKRGKKAVFGDIDKTKRGALKGADLELTTDKIAVEKGVYGEAFAMENMGVGGSLEMMQAALTKFGGGKTLLEGAGSLGMGKMAENLGVSTQHLRGLMKVEVAVQEEKDALIEKAEKELSGKALSDRKAEINAMKTQETIDGMSDEEQATLKEAAASEMDLMKEQTKLQDSIMNQMERLIDFLMNQLYSVLSSILDMFIGLAKKMDFFGGMSDVEKMRGEERRVQKMDAGPIKDAMIKALKDTSGLEAGERLAALGEAEQASKVEKVRQEDIQGFLGEEMGPRGPEQNAVFEQLVKALDTEGLRKAISDVGGEKTLEELGDKPLTADNISEALIKAESDKSARDVFAQALQMDPEAVEEMRDWETEQAIAESDAAQKEYEASEDYVPPSEMGTWHGGSAELQGGVFGNLGNRAAAALDPEGSSAAVDDYIKHLKAPEGTPYGQAPFDPANPFAGFSMGGTGEVEPTEEEIEVAKATKETAEAIPKVGTEISDLHKTGKKDGSFYVKFGTSFLKGDYKKVVAEAMLESMRLALFEYFMYSALDPEEVAKTLSEEGLSGPEFAKALGKGAPSGETASTLFNLEASKDPPKRSDFGPGKEGDNDYKEAMAKFKKKKARRHGGEVRRIDQFGFAEFEPRSGEGITNIGPGESISPAYNKGRGGGGSQHVTVSLRGDAGRLFDAKIDNRVYENKRRERNQ